MAIQRVDAGTCPGKLQDAPPGDASKGDPVMVLLAEIKSMLGKLVGDEEDEEYEADEGDEGDDVDETADDITEEPEPIGMQSPNLLAFQKILGVMKKQQNQINALSTTGKTNAIETRLKSLCDEDSTLHFETVREHMLKFSNPKDRERFVDFLSMQAAPSAAGPHVLDSLNSTPVSDNPRLRKVVEGARRDYRDTVGQYDQTKAMCFQALEGTEEEFLTRVVEKEKASPGWYDRTYRLA